MCNFVYFSLGIYINLSAIFFPFSSIYLLIYHLFTILLPNYLTIYHLLCINLIKIEEEAVDDLEPESGGEDIGNNSDEDYDPQEDGYRSSKYVY